MWCEHKIKRQCLLPKSLQCLCLEELSNGIGGCLIFKMRYELDSVIPKQNSRSNVRQRTDYLIMVDSDLK